MRRLMLMAVGLVALTGCGAAADGESDGGTGSAPPAKVVQLARDYSAQSVVLEVDQALTVRLDNDIVIANPGQPTTCDESAGEILGFDPCPNPASREIRYVANRVGTTTLSTPVAPRCERDEVCPQWIATAQLRVTVRA